MLPTRPGVYLFKDSAGRVLYIGKAVNLKARVKSYFQKSVKLGPKTTALINQTAKIDHIPVESEFEALLLEAALIKKHQPRYNSRAKDDKRPLYIKITKEEFPKVTTARAKDLDEKAIFFGPFPYAQTVRQVLRILRRIFPFCSCKKNKGKPCLYWHIGLCNPSPRIIIKQPPKVASFQKRIYQKNIRYLTSFLKRKKSSLISQLKKEMEITARNENFEEAAKIRNQIERLEFITQPHRRIADYLANPNLLVDQRQEELRQLYNKLKQHFDKLKWPLQRIEAYDISNIRGKKATGSMIVFIDGEPEKTEYRRFKIRFEQKPDDVAMIKEVLKRRFAHQDWDYPNLIVVDGGKGQVNGAREILSQYKLRRIPIIGLVKRKEKVIIPGKEVKLPKDSPALHLLRRLRDEAHRFALFYHRTLRAKTIL